MRARPLSRCCHIGRLCWFLDSHLRPRALPPGLSYIKPVHTGTQTTFMADTDLYLPLKAYLEGAGYAVKGEVNGCDLVGVRDGSRLYSSSAR
jgi:hypothetical protein